jgi:hypothetical protein
MGQEKAGGEAVWGGASDNAREGAFITLRLAFVHNVAEHGGLNEVLHQSSRPMCVYVCVFVCVCCCERSRSLVWSSSDRKLID